jgi:hypothetical protein
MSTSGYRACYSLSVYVGQINHALTNCVELCTKITQTRTGTQSHLIIRTI